MPGHVCFKHLRHEPLQWEESMSDHSPILSGLRGRCPACGAGKLYSGYMQLAECCTDCSHPIANGDEEDIPITSLLIVIGAIGMAGVIISIVRFDWPTWLVVAVWPPLTVIASLVALPPLRGLITALQHRQLQVSAPAQTAREYESTPPA
jgi:uncharacterized protein (DUF983 family)